MRYLSVRTFPAASLLALFPLLIFNYHPMISLGMNSGVHLDISILYAALTLALLSNIPILWNERRKLLTSHAWKIGSIFILFIWLSCLWSPNTFRALLTAAFFTLVFGIFSTILAHFQTIVRNKRILIRVTGYSFVAAGILALWQILGDALGFPREITLLPAMYSGDVFGIARPTAFSLEPQFFGSLLLVPLLYGSYRVLNHASRYDLLLFGVSATFLLLTLSRGALLAGLIGLIILICLLQPSSRSITKLFATGVMSVVLTTAIVAGTATMRNDSISGYDAVRGTLSQLSLGKILLPQTSTEIPNNQSVVVGSQPTYVETSTSSRLSMNDAAMKLWASSLNTILFGVGIGGFGASIQAVNLELPKSLVANNFYLEMLAEVGLIGILLLLSFVSTLIYSGVSKKQYFLLALAIAFLIQWLFFSGISNVVHVWIIFGFLAAAQLPPKTTMIHRRV